MSTPRSLFEGPTQLSRSECEAIAKRALAMASSGVETRVTINNNARGNTRFAVNQVSTGGDNYNTTVTIRSSMGSRTGVANTNRLDDEGLRHAVQTAETLAKLAPEDPEAMPELGPATFDSQQGYRASTAALGPDGRAAAVRAVTDQTRAAGLVATGFMESDVGPFYVANSKGLSGYSNSTVVSMTTTVRTPDGRGSGWAGAEANDWKAIDPAALGARAIEKARRSVDPVAIEPGRYTVVLEPTAVGNLVQLIAFAMNARAADEGRSFFSKRGGGTKIGEKVIDERVSIISDPLDPEVPATTFTGEGVPISRTPWIENGVVRNLAYDRYWAQRQQRAPMPFAGTLRMSGGTQSLDDLIAGTDRGVLVTRFWYIRPVDPRTILYTGLTRDGTFLIEKGKITKAVKNLRFNESPIFMLNNLDAAGRPVRVSASEDGGPGFAIVVPPIRVRDFTFSSLSDAV